MSSPIDKGHQEGMEAWERMKAARLLSDPANVANLRHESPEDFDKLLAAMLGFLTEVKP